MKLLLKLLKEINKLYYLFIIEQLKIKDSEDYDLLKDILEDYDNISLIKVQNYLCLKLNTCEEKYNWLANLIKDKNLNSIVSTNMIYTKYCPQNL